MNSLAINSSRPRFYSLACLILGLTFAPASHADKVLMEWAFNREGSLEGWQPNAHVESARISEGVLHFSTRGSDPIFELKPLINILASPWQAIEIRMRADHDGDAEFFWSNTSEGRYGGFSPEKHTVFKVTGDGLWRTYRVFPFWHSEGKIVRLRFDPFDATQFAVDFLRIIELPMPAAVQKADFDFAADNQGWQPVGAVSLSHTNSVMGITSAGADGFALSPPVEIDTVRDNFVSLGLAATAGKYATLYFASDQSTGLKSLSFPIDADGREHVYNLDMLAAGDWRGRVIALGLRPFTAGAPQASAKASAQMRWLKVSPEPQGPPELKVISFALEEAMARVNRPVRLSAVIANAGGQSVTNLRVQLQPLPGLMVLKEPGRNAIVPTLAFGEEAKLAWTVQSSRPVRAEARLEVTADNAARAARAISMEITPPVEIPRLADDKYVPEPKPVRGPYDVGVYYFPGWKSASQWHPLQRFPERRPVLGWYREGEPEVADWHIKWAVEHGITFFAYDWYWSQGARQLEHALHEGFFKARYRHLLKFCLLWANHNAPNTSSPADCVKVTRYWIENYFKRPEYYRLDGKPVMIIFSPDRLTQDLGSEKVRKAFDAMREECRQAGLPGLYLLACAGSAGQARLAAAEGYDAVTAYNWPGLGMATGQLYAPYADLLPAYRKNWDHIIEQSNLPLMPPICGGWDSRPWHGENNLVRHDRTPALFEAHLRDARALVERQPAGNRVLRAVLIEAWNEWGEGSYIEPHQEFGFGYLDAIRKVFTAAAPDHADITPADASLGPYDVAEDDALKIVWQFQHDTQGWDNVMDLAEVGVQNQALQARSTGNDPAFFGPPMQARASEYSAVEVRLRLKARKPNGFKDRAQLFWRTRQLAESESTSVRFEVIGDGQWRTYRVPVAQNRRWRGIITRLRLDPVNQTGIEIEVAEIGLIR